MTDIQLVEHTNPFTGETETNVIIDRGNGEFTSMLKAHYEELQAQQPNILS